MPSCDSKNPSSRDGVLDRAGAVSVVNRRLLPGNDPSEDQPTLFPPARLPHHHQIDPPCGPPAGFTVQWAIVHLELGLEI